MVTFIEISMKLDFSINRKFVLGLNKAKQLGLEH